MKKRNRIPIIATEDLRTKKKKEGDKQTNKFAQIRLKRVFVD